MKKVFLWGFVVYVIVAVGLIIIFEKDVDDSIAILSVEKPYARVITEGETIDIPLYISEKQTFLLDKNLIDNVYIKSDGDETEVSMIAIKDQEQTFVKDEIYYFHYYLEIGFQSVYSENLELTLKNAILTVEYENGESIDLSIGNMYLLFSEINQPVHLDFSQMYGLYKEDVINGIYIGLENITNHAIEILSIETLYQDMQIDLGHIQRLYNVDDHINDLESYLPNYQSLVDTLSVLEPITLTNHLGYILPIQYLNKYPYITRFPLIINYKYQDQTYKYIIDDFMFSNYANDFYKELYSFETYQYYSK